MTQSPELSKRIDSTVFIDYGQFWVASESPSFQLPPVDKMHGLVAASGNGVIVLTGIAAGLVHVAVEVLKQQPAELDESNAWEAVAEASIPTPTVPLGVRALGHIAEAPLSGLPLPEESPWLRLRVYALGRAQNWDGVDEEPAERYLLQLWPTEEYEPEVVLLDD